MCATNRDLRALCRQGLFREDLYYRLAVLPIEMPPLRTHPEDILPIAEHWLRKLALGGPAATPLHFSADAQRALYEHDYPGNVRELVNVVRRIVLFAQHSVLASATSGTGILDGDLVRRMLAEDPFRTLRPESRSTSFVVSPQSGLLGSAPVQAGPLSLRELEIQHIEKLLREHKNITTVAKLLEIDRRTLQRKLRSLDIDWQDE